MPLHPVLSFLPISYELFWRKQAQPQHPALPKPPQAEIMNHHPRALHQSILTWTLPWLFLAVSAVSGAVPAPDHRPGLRSVSDSGTHYSNNLRRYGSGFGPGGGGGGSSPYHGPGDSGYPGADGSDFGDGFGGFGAGFDIGQALNYRRIHGILAALAMVLLFPIGSILLRVLPGRLAVWAHAAFQALAWCVFVAGAALGIYLVRSVTIPGGDSLLQDPSTRYHPIIGLVLLALLVVQPVFGFVHHRVYKRVQRRQVWSYLHLGIGRLGITLGIINGGLGLHLAGASAYSKRVYAIVSAIMWSLWMAVAIWGEWRRARRNRQTAGADSAVAKAGVEPRRASRRSTLSRSSGERNGSVRNQRYA